LEERRKFVDFVGNKIANRPPTRLVDETCGLSEQSFGRTTFAQVSLEQHDLHGLRLQAQPHSLESLLVNSTGTKGTNRPQDSKAMIPAMPADEVCNHWFLDRP